ncbi:Gfo/Idh/MocA family oxidoreductase [Albimonas sp. CAU 1670]|uniref:Gfo/Idh/MocA family oxidoreductase n=1 Tax=Albimonas sp. CAU 1670 TaxID=3032599 RepID=UPI0023DB59E0|nr:Gfo/Idh/MocA family oxidoreductase [Albimonas sp. CAU 1670]MDF2235735.1 Gfo/Idh/MocA family oxidoreductase [Albimonas sp. CAU 1670]
MPAARPPVPIAVVGAGAIGRRHAALLAASGPGRLAALVDPAPETAALAARLGCPHVASLDDLPAATAGAILATPTPLHLPQALTCLERGLPVLVEKPVTATAAEAETLAEASARSGVPVLAGHHRRHNPRIAAAKAAIEGGLLGRVISAQVSVLLCKPDDYFAPDWRRAPGAGPILTNLVHDIDLMRHLLGEVVEVRALASSAIRGFEIEDSAAALMRFESGAMGAVAVSDAAAAPWSWELTAAENPDYPATGQSCLWLAGTGGSLELPSLRLWRQRGPRSWFSPMTPELLPVTDADPLVGQLDHFAAVIRGETAPLVSAADAGRSVAVVEAIAAAARPSPAERKAS